MQNTTIKKGPYKHCSKNMNRCSLNERDDKMKMLVTSYIRDLDSSRNSCAEKPWEE